MAKRSSKEKIVHRRAVLQSLVVGLGAIGSAARSSPVTIPQQRRRAPTFRRRALPRTMTSSCRTSPPVNAAMSPEGPEPGVGGAREAARERASTPLPSGDLHAGVARTDGGKERSTSRRVRRREGGLKRVIVIVQHVMGTNGLDAGAYDAGDAGKKDAGPTRATPGRGRRRERRRRDRCR